MGRELININSLDVRAKSFNPQAFRGAVQEVQKAKGQVVCLVHLGYLRGYIYRDHPEIELDRKWLEGELGYLPDERDYDRYLQNAIRYLHGTEKPVVIVNDIRHPFSEGEVNLSDFGSLAMAVPVMRWGEPKPRMESASGHPFRTHWSALRRILNALGINQIDVMGEIYIAREDAAPFYEVGGFWQMLFAKEMWEAGFCVDEVAERLMLFSRGKLHVNILQEHTFPGLRHFSSRIKG